MAAGDDDWSLICFEGYLEHPTIQMAERWLESLGWKRSGIHQYTSPDGAISCDSLHQVYDHLTGIFGNLDVPVPHEHEANLDVPVPFEQENLAAVVPHEQEANLAEVQEDSVDIEPMYCPQALKDWVLRQSGSKEDVERKEISNKILSLKAKQHLVAIGWILKKMVKNRGKTQELRYFPPSSSNLKRSYGSLVTACKAVIEDTASNGMQSQTQAQNVLHSPAQEQPLSSSIASEALIDWPEKIDQKMQDMTERFFAYRDQMNEIIAEYKHVPAGMMEMCFENLQALHHDVSEKHMQLKEALVSHRNPVSAPQQPGGHPPSMQPQLQEQTQQQQSQEERPEKRPRQL